MATIRQKVEFSRDNPNDPDAIAFMKGLSSGNFDDVAIGEGFDISTVSPTFVQKKGDVGTGFEPTFQFTGEENILGAALKTLGNIPRSSFELAKEIKSAVVNPLRTIKSIASLAKGIGASLGEAALEKTSLGQQILEIADKSRIERGLEPLKRNKDGVIQVEGTAELKSAKQVGDFFKERYGGIENIKETIVEDPVGFLGDLATIITGGGAAVTKVGKVSKLGRVARAGEVVAEAGRVIEPITAAGKVIGEAKRFIPKVGETQKSILRDVSPFDREELTRAGIVKALDITPADVTKFEKVTGNKIDEFILKNTTSNTPAGIGAEASVIKKASMQQVRDLIGDVDIRFSGDEIKPVRQALDSLEKVYGDTLGLEDLVKEISDLKNLEDFSLSDAQRVKELIDDADVIFRASGDIKSGVKAKGLANIRKSIKEFIENEVKNNLGDEQGNVIKELNNRTQTAKGLENMIELRAAKQLTRQGLSIFELLLGLGGFSQFGLTGAAGVLAAKRLIESPAFRLSLARKINSMDKSVLNKISKQIGNKSLPKESIKILRDIVDEAQQNRQFIESGAKAISEITEEEE